MAGGPSRHAASPAAAAAAGGHGARRRPGAALRARARDRGSPSGDLDLAFALLWAVGIACALGAAYQAKFHRLAALMLLGGAGLVTCVSFVWLSAPDLALTQLVVETVTTVLLLLGLRWLPKRIEGIGPGGRWTRHDAMVSRPRLRHRGRRRSGTGDAGLRGDDAAGTRQHLALFRGERLHARRRHQHRERHPGRLPRLRHPWRDHGARRRRADRLRAAAAVPPGPREHPGPRTAARPGRLRRGPSGSQKGDTVKDAMAVPALHHGAAVPGDRRRRRVPAPARARPARRRIRRRHHHGGRVHPAIHGSRHDLGRGAPAGLARALDGRRPPAGGRHRGRRLAVRPPVPDLVFLLC